MSGGERVLLEVARALLGRGDAALGIVATPGPVAEALAEAGAEVEVLDCRKTYDLPGARRLARLLGAWGADVLETHGFLRNVHGRLARGLFGGPPAVGVVHRAMGWERRWQELGGKERARVVYYRFVDRATARFATATLAVSGAVRDELVAAGLPAEAITVVPNGIREAPTPPPRGETRAALGLSPHAPVLVTAARLSPLKDLATMVRAVAAAPPWHLLVADEGPEEPALRALVDELELAPRVKLLGRREDVPALLAAGDAFGLSSLAGEGLPIALLEAMRAGLPAVVTDEPGTREAATPDETALVVPPADPAAFAAALARLGSDSVLGERLGRGARAAFEARFTADRMVNAHLAALDRAAESG